MDNKAQKTRAIDHTLALNQAAVSPAPPLMTEIADFMHKSQATLWATALSITLSVMATPVTAAQPQTDLPRIELTAGMHRIVAQVARTSKQREIGLMYRAEMPANEGMLFVFETPDAYCFWMKNTLIPLSAAFIDDNGTVVNVAEMAAGSLDQHCAKQPVRFVLEMNKQWFEKRGFGAGTQLGGFTRAR